MIDRSARRLAVVALSLYAGFIAYQSLADGGAWHCGGAALATAVRLSRSDLLANVVAYVPLGLLYALVAAPPAGASWRRRALGLLPGLLGITALSWSLELAQSCLAGRNSSAWDWAANTLGGGVGLVAASVVPALIGATVARDANRWRAHPSLAALTLAVPAGWVLSQTMPWVFAVDVGTIRSNLAFLRHWSDGHPLDWWHVVRHAGAWLAIACAWRLASRTAWRAGIGLLATCGVSLLLQMLLDARTPLTFEEGIGMGLCVMAVLPVLMRAGRAPRGDAWALALLIGAALVVAAYQLRPDPDAESSARAFSWVPLVGLGGLKGALDYALLFGWFGLATVIASRWAGRADLPSARWWPALAILATLALEALQTGIPGRGPDVSAPVFTLLAVLGTTVVVKAAAVE